MNRPGVVARPSRSGRCSAVQCTTGIPTCTRGTRQRGDVGHHLGGGPGEVGKDRVLAHDVLLHLDGEHGGVTRGGESGEIEGHDVSVRISRDGHRLGESLSHPHGSLWMRSVLEAFSLRRIQPIPKSDRRSEMVLALVALGACVAGMIAVAMLERRPDPPASHAFACANPKRSRARPRGSGCAGRPSFPTASGSSRNRTRFPPRRPRSRANRPLPRARRHPNPLRAAASAVQ